MGADVTKKLEIIISSKAELGNLEKVKKVLIESKNRLKELGDKYKSATSSMGGFAGTASKLRTKLAILEKAFAKQGKKLTDSRKKAKDLNRELKSLGGTVNKTTKSTRKHRQEVDKLGRSYKKTEKAARGYDNTHGNIRGHTEGLRRVIGALRNQILLFVFALRGLINVITSSVEASNQLEASMVGLRAVAEKTGTSFYDAQIFMEEFTEKGLISVADTAAGLKNLLAAGFGMPEAIQLMRTLGDAAAFNRQGTLEYGAAIVGATQGIKNQNSIMTDNAGITKNLNIMYKEYAATLGKGAMSLSEVEKRQAIFNGFLKEGALFVGNMSKLTDTYMGKMQKLSQSIFTAKAAFGDLIKSGLGPFVAQIEKVVAIIAGWITQNEILIKSEIKVFLETLTASLRVVWDVLSAVNDVFKFFGTGLKDAIVFFALFKGATFVMTKFAVIIGSIYNLMKLAFGAQVVRWITNLSKLQKSVFALGMAFRVAGHAGVGVFTKALMVLRVVITALSGPLGIILGLIALVAAAWAYFALRSKQASTQASEALKKQREETRKLIRANLELANSMVARIEGQLKDVELTREKTMALEAQLKIELKLQGFYRRKEAVASAREKLGIDTEAISATAKSSLRFIEDASIQSKEAIKGLIKDEEKAVEMSKKSALNAFEKLDYTQRTARANKVMFEKQLQQANLFDRERDKIEEKQEKSVGLSERSAEAQNNALITANADLKTKQIVLQALKEMLGLAEKTGKVVDDDLKKQGKSISGLLSLIARLEGEAAKIGVEGIGLELVNFKAKIAGLEVQYEKWAASGLKIEKHLERLRELLDDLKDRGPLDILKRTFQELQDKIAALGMTPLEAKFNKIGVEAEKAARALDDFLMTLSLDDLKDPAMIEFLTKVKIGIKTFADEQRKILTEETTKKWADKSADSIRKLSDTFIDLASSRIQRPIAGGLFGAGDKGAMDRIKTQVDHAHRLIELQREYEDRKADIEATKKGPEDELRIAEEVARARMDLDTQITYSAAIAAEERIAIVQHEWEQRLDMMEQFVGGWQNLGGVLADVFIGQSNEMEAQIARQRDLMDRGKIDQKQFEDRKAQIEKAAQKDREQAAAKFAANMLRQAGQVAQAYLMQAAVAQFATASSTAANSAMWAAHFTAQATALGVAAAGAMAIPGAGPFISGMYTTAAAAMTGAAAISGAAATGSISAGIGLAAAGIVVGVGTGLAAGAIEANNLGSEGGFLGTPTEDVFEDRNKRLGGSIRAQEVHLSINPVTYIQSEGDIFIGEGITVETFKGMVNEAFVNRAQDALETGELEIDSLVNVKG